MDWRCETVLNDLKNKYFFNLIYGKIEKLYIYSKIKFIIY